MDYMIKETPTPISLPDLDLTLPEPSPLPELFDDDPPSNRGSNPAFPIIMGMVPVVLILIGVLVGYRYLSNRRE
jgi:hypothetical protein